ncbi:MAG: helix-turn-helix transcriptional regulator [Clostridiales bacterium]|nr:helix-turn-helix transcriptional regulator [Clostridiales bacterium]
MTITEAVLIRIEELLRERNMTKRQLIEKSAIPAGTMASLYKKLAKSINLVTLYALARGFDMKISEFVNHEAFLNVEVKP